ncbi:MULTISPECIES: type II toxin-antitoxin system Phd/YefM family antitoxin [Actinoalloteichus]|uniref:Prevent-host-death family protein n=1 Tax=Actinoalloteichus fjordicus TaxID=1612552 RepID=A0AAC9LBA8_9PSEU|nr:MULTISPECIES: type II toxin-antitoxin system prevent-host-death family antitoxin [Actinoalloteichus]APU13285.1 prevent-host-death family protein [Actinoalloteichus fjordicus]APU19236.1 prevent-host-death family protein [Actinoalloteichus sp. GBA129-24]
MSQRIGSRELRRDEAEIIRRVEAGESFTVTQAGRPVADLVPHRPGGRPATTDRTLGAVQAEFRSLPPVDASRWDRDRRRSDSRFGADDPLENPWDRGTRHGSAVTARPARHPGEGSGERADAGSAEGSPADTVAPATGLAAVVGRGTADSAGRRNDRSAPGGSYPR